MYDQNNSNSGIMWGLIAMVVVAFLFLAFGAMANSKSDGVYIFSQVVGDVGDGSVAIAGDDNVVNNEPQIVKENPNEPMGAFDGLGLICGGVFLLMCLFGLGYIVIKVMFNTDDNF